MSGVSLSQLLKLAEIPCIQAGLSVDPVISSISTDSRKVTPNSLFVIIKGSKSNGSEFIEEAIARGAVALLGEELGINQPDSMFPKIAVSDAREALARIANAFYGKPFDRTLNIGVTGTNGKTSTTWIIAEALGRLNFTTAHLGTLGKRIIFHGSEELFPSDHTTPDALETYSFQQQAIGKGVSAAVLEVSSHALSQHRTTGIPWDAAVFTNLTRDHLDYYGTIESYGLAKEQLFTRDLKGSSRKDRVAIINIDDSFGENLYRKLVSERGLSGVFSYSRANPTADCYVRGHSGDLFQTKIEVSLKVHGKIEEISFCTKLIGDYNVTNICGALLTLSALIPSLTVGGNDVKLSDILSTLAEIPVVPGRLELVANTKPGIFIDYAHTPDALTRAQASLRELTKGRLITVFGCGGDRDKGKRPMMAKAVSEGSDIGIVTSDNPRGERPESIIEDITKGFAPAGSSNGFQSLVIVDREEAIRHAVGIAQKEDAILIAGKGHEDYQEIGGIKHSFLDREVCERVLREIRERVPI